MKSVCTDSMCQILFNKTYDRVRSIFLTFTDIHDQKLVQTGSHSHCREP